MHSTHHIIKPTNPRVYLVLIHGMFLVLYGCIRAQLDTAWFVGLLTLGQSGRAVGPRHAWDQHRALDVGRRVRIDEKSSMPTNAPDRIEQH